MKLTHRLSIYALICDPVRNFNAYRPGAVHSRPRVAPDQPIQYNPASPTGDSQATGFLHHQQSTMKAICLWSGPRNVSTALMYSFAQRSDTRVVDEPLYGHFLRVSGTMHPGRDEVLATVNCDGDAVMRDLLANESDTGPDLLFMKQMAHHLVNVDRNFMQETENIFLVRDPQQMLPSLTVQMPHAQIQDTGLETQWRLYRELLDLGQRPAILDSRELLLDPAVVLEKLCAHLEIPYTDVMLSWPAGPRPEDGIWAPHWYHALHKSTGFSPYVEKTDFPEELEPLLAECKPWYEKLIDHAIRASAGD